MIRLGRRNHDDETGVRVFLKFPIGKGNGLNGMEELAHFSCMKRIYNKCHSHC